MRKFYVGLICGLLALFAIPLIACSKSSAPEFKEFISFSQYKNFDENVVAIDVQWDAGGYWDEFTVTDTEQVNEIVNLFKNTTMKKLDGPRLGDNHGIDFVYSDGTKKSVSLFTIRENGAYYFYQNSSIRNFISQLRDNRAN